MSEKDLGALANAVSNAPQLADFIEALLQDLTKNDDEWENPTLPRYLEALSALVAGMSHPNAGSGFYDQHPFDGVDSKAWKTFAMILLGAAYYE